MMKKSGIFVFAILATGIVGTGAALAGEADVVKVSVKAESGGTFRFAVAVKHGDEGWDHFANKWEVIGADGTVYGTRILAHPHVNEQPFVRAKAGLKIPNGITEVTVRAHDSVHEFGGKEMTVALPGR